MPLTREQVFVHGLSRPHGAAEGLCSTPSSGMSQCPCRGRHGASARRACGGPDLTSRHAPRCPLPAPCVGPPSLRISRSCNAHARRSSARSADIDGLAMPSPRLDVCRCWSARVGLRSMEQWDAEQPGREQREAGQIVLLLGQSSPLVSQIMPRAENARHRRYRRVRPTIYSYT